MTHKEKAERICKEIKSLNRIGIDIIVGKILLTEVKKVDLRRHWREHIKRSKG